MNTKQTQVSTTPNTPGLWIYHHDRETYAARVYYNHLEHCLVVDDRGQLFFLDNPIFAWTGERVLIGEGRVERAPGRVQLRRTKGWRKPANTVCVCRPSKWGNTYRVGMAMGPERERAEAVRLFRAGLMARLDHHTGPKLLAEIRAELRGKNVACWCPLDGPCHADVLLEIANAPEGECCPQNTRKGAEMGES